MPTPKLNTTTSIEDFLRSQKKDASFAARRTLYNKLGLGERLGEYTGSASQNINFLKTLRNQQTVTPAAEAKQFIFSATAPTTTFRRGLGGTQTTTPQTLGRPPAEIFTARPTQPTPTSAAPATDTLGVAAGIPAKPKFQAEREQLLQRIAQQDPQRADQIADILGFGGSPNTFTTPSGAVVDASGKLISAPKGVDTAVAKSEGLDMAAQERTGVSAAAYVPETNLEERDLVNEFLSSQEGQLLAERHNLKTLSQEAKAEATKQALEKRYAEEKASLESKLASRGLFLSGIRASQVRALADSLATSVLGVDRELASKLLDANLDLRESILKGVADLVEEAKDDQKDAIAQLNKAGLAVIDGQLVPTLEAQKAQTKVELDEAKLAIDQAKADFNQAVTLDERRVAQRKLELAETELLLKAKKQQSELADELEATEGFHTAKIEADVREDAVELMDRWSDPLNPSDEELISTFRTLRTLYSPQEASEEALMDLIGIDKASLLPSTEDLAEAWLGDVVSPEIKLLQQIEFKPSAGPVIDLI